ncbi:hypothetical protein B0O99DRAFT_673999 [Bisporella sp. PMI_857]|nr:hypothetical protein B0O99DRAFT_673999 [Bisporella sp. PMI_857]
MMAFLDKLLALVSREVVEKKITDFWNNPMTWVCSVAILLCIGIHRLSKHSHNCHANAGKIPVYRKLITYGNYSHLRERHAEEEEEARIMTRSPFTIYIDAQVGVLFPKEIAGHLSLFAARSLTKELAPEFVGSKLDVQVTCGKGFLPLVLRITEFNPKSANCYVPVIRLDSGNKLVRQSRLAMPLALQPGDFDITARSWKKQPTQMIQNEESLSRWKTGGVSSKIAIAIFRYYDLTHMSGSNNIVARALNLLAANIAMDRALKFTLASGNSIRESAGGSIFPKFDSGTIHRLLNRQIKTLINEFLFSETHAILKELDTDLKDDEKSWASTFCVTSLLCICCEVTQVAIDMSSQENNEADMGNYLHASRSVEHFCNIIIDRVYSYFNLIRYGPGPRLDKNCVDLVQNIQQIILDEGEQIHSLARSPHAEASSRSLDDHLIFTARNTGRLTSKLLVRCGGIFCNIF